MRAGGERRGSSYDRRRRREKLLREFDPELGEGVARCQLAIAGDRCHGIVDDRTLSVDRIDPEGGYDWGNVRPACIPCQNKQGALITQARRIDWFRWREEAAAAGIDWNGAM